VQHEYKVESAAERNKEAFMFWEVWYTLVQPPRVMRLSFLRCGNRRDNNINARFLGLLKTI